MDLLLNDKIAVVTGASKCIGLAVTRALAEEGTHVIAGSRTTASLDAIEGVTGVAIDLAEPGAPSQLVQRALDEHGRIDVLAGMGGIPSGRFPTPEEVATLVVLLASERTANVTGANFVIDGGLIKTT